MSKMCRMFSMLIMVVFILPTLFTCVDATDYSMYGDNDRNVEVISNESISPKPPSNGYAYAIPNSPMVRSSDGPMYHFQSVVDNFTASCYSESWNRDKTERYPIDIIIAEVSVYEYGSYVTSRKDEQHNSYTARALYRDDAFSFIVNREAYGYHFFELDGYEDMVQETYAN